MRIALLTICLLATTGCQSLYFYHQAIVGQSKLLLKRQQNRDVLVSEDADPALKYRIELAGEIVAFAREAGLPAEGVYQTYVETGQRFIVWNVFAARPFQLALKTSCFPIAGCVSYRGFFSQSDARGYASDLEKEGYEVYVGGVTAYSTLGWFEDPLLDTFLFRPEDQLAALLFHELAHRLVYIKGDTRFNESLATAVERFLLNRWLTSRGEAQYYDAFLASRERQDAVLVLIDATRAQLRTLYESEQPEPEMQDRKETIVDELVVQYTLLADSWPEGSEFKNWMSTPINNAKLESVADYNEWVPAMMSYLTKHGITGFEREMKRLAGMTSEDRACELKVFLTDSRHRLARCATFGIPSADSL